MVATVLLYVVAKVLQVVFSMLLAGSYSMWFLGCCYVVSKVFQVFSACCLVFATVCGC